MRTKLLVNCATGKQEYISLTDDELAEFESRETVEVQKRIDASEKIEQKRLIKSKYIGQQFTKMTAKERNEFLAIMLEQLGILDENGIITDSNNNLGI